MLFGGGGDAKDGDKADFMSKVKQASEMFNPEMLQKYSEVGNKIQAVQVTSSLMRVGRTQTNVVLLRQRHD